jgi:thiol-disulfide isomerase/thioredoxin
MKRELYVLGLIMVLGVGAITIIISSSNQTSDVAAGSNSNVSKIEPQPYVEIKNPAGFVNTNNQPIAIADYVGKQVILLDVMTYSCINCQRTFPYVNAWYETYKDEGLIVIGLHTPEFAFEKDKANVEAVMKEFGITFPVVLDNEYATWNALGNRFWPRKYLIDIHGNIVYDHIGEGAYEETEKKIKELLKERATVLGQSTPLDDSLAVDEIVDVKTTARSPETYFGSARNEYLGNGIKGQSGRQTFSLPGKAEANMLYLSGIWNIQDEYAEAEKDSVVRYTYSAKEVYLVAESEAGGEIEVWQDGEQVTKSAGQDVRDGTVMVKDSRLYKLINNGLAGEHTIELQVSPGVKLFAFTFG